MSLEIIFGRSKSGKSKYIYDNICSLVKEGKEVMLIVPEQYTHAAEKKLLRYVDAIEDNKVEVFSFNRLAYATAIRLGFPDKLRIDAIGKALTVRDILKNNDFCFYRGVADQNGFADMISRTIGEFKKYMILPESLSQISEQTDDVVLSMKLKDLSLVYSEYEKRISSRFSDSDDSLSVLAGRLSESDIYKSKHIFIDEFSTFVPQEYCVIRELCNNCANVSITLTCDSKERNTTLFMPTSDTVKQLSKYVSSKVKHTYLSNSYFASPELSYLEKHLYSFATDKYPDMCDNIKVYSLANPRSEVEICASSIMNLLRKEKYMYKDIGIICSDIDVYARHIERIFEQNNIEYFIDNKNDVINHHLIRFILGLLEVYIYEYNYASVFNYLKAAYVDVGSTDIALLEKYIKKTNLKRTTWLNDDKWRALLSANFPEGNHTTVILDDLRDNYIKPLALMHEKIKGRHCVRDNCIALYDFLTDIKLPETISKYIEKFNDESELRYAKEYEKLWEIVTSTLDEIVSLSGDTVTNVTEFYNLLVTAFSQSTIGVIPSSIDRVIVGNTERTRVDGLKVLFVLGVNEGVFPMSSKPDGVLTDNDKELMKICDVDFSTTSSVAAFYSQFCAYNALTMPTEKLFISYSKAGNDFKSMHKSYIIDRIIRLFNIEEKSEASFKPGEILCGKSNAKEQLALAVAGYNISGYADDFWKSVYKYFSKNTDFVERINYFLESDNIARNLSDKNLKLLMTMLSHTSVSKLERYMSCKYAYFIDYILKVEQLKEDRVDALDIGNITHHVLELLSKEFGKTRESFINTSDSVVLNRTEQLIAEELNLFSDKTDELSSRDAYVISRLKNSVFLCFKAVRNQFINSSFEPLGYEIEFNDNTEIGSIKVDTPKGNHIELTGKIDRADIYNDGDCAYVRVIDYKTGYKDFKLDDVLYGLTVQLIVYLNKLVSSNDKYNYGGALYFPVTVPMMHSGSHTDADKAQQDLAGEFKLKGIVPFNESVLAGYEETIADSLRRGTAKNKRVSMEGFAIMDKYLSNKIGCICDEILSGNIEISPTKKGDRVPCDYCNYNSICRFDCADTKNNYTYYKSKNIYEEIIKEMEEAIGVDGKSTESN